MALQKQGFNFSFGQGVDTRTDPNQVAAGKMLRSDNGVFSKTGLFMKRNGFPSLTALPDATSTTLTTLNGNLLATGSNLEAFSQNTNQWSNRGTIQPVSLQVQAVVRTSASQTVVDSATAPSGLTCIAFTEGSSAYYQVVDSTTGQIIVARTALVATANLARVFVLNKYFIVTYLATVSATPHLQYVAIPINNLGSPLAAADISTQVLSITTGYDAIVANNSLIIAFTGSDGGGAIRAHTLSATLTVSSAKVIATYTATVLSVAADISGTTPVIYISWWASGSTNGFTTVLNPQLVTITAPTQIITTTTINKMTSIATSGSCNVLVQVTNTYSYSSVRSDYVNKININAAGTVVPATTILRSVGLASKPFLSGTTQYCLVAYSGAFQPSYFLIDTSGNIILKLAYANGAGYAATQVLPSVASNGTSLQFSYLYKSQLVAVNKSQGVANTAGIYAQTGVNLATITINESGQHSSEIASSLHLTGGFLWQYDSIKPVEHGFFVWPEDLLTSTSGAGGLLTAQQYYYIFCYEWTDAAGMLHRSAPSIPVGQVTTGATSTNTINVPTLRLTYKTGTNKVRLVGYRWSTAQQNYYQFTSISSPSLNDTTTDSLAITDTLADSSILGNELLYTTGGVVENISAPACSASTLFRSKLFLIDAEDTNTIWFSKTVIAATPVELSDLLTIYVAPTTGAQGSTGGATALFSMDDKLIIFKTDAIYYVTGSGPDNTGANNDFSDPVFISGTVGCSNPNSIVLTPDGLMFQSDKGIWLLGRNLQTSYIGSEVDGYNDAQVLSALTIPGTNEVRFTLDTGITLLYDYNQQQWGTFSGLPSISSCLYQGSHTCLNSLGQVFQEQESTYLDGTKPVLMSFTTAWLKLTGLQGFQRAYYAYLLCNYLTPHKLNVQIAYDYDPAIKQTILISPNNYSAPFGGDNLFGGSEVFGGPSSVEQWRLFFEQQKCQAIQITVTEVYDASLGVAAGAGLTFSGINLVVGGLSTYPKLAPKQSAG